MDDILSLKRPREQQPQEQHTKDEHEQHTKDEHEQHMKAKLNKVTFDDAVKNIRDECGILRKEFVRKEEAGCHYGWSFNDGERFLKREYDERIQAAADQYYEEEINKRMIYVPLFLLDIME